MASLRGAIAAAAGASSRRGSALVCPCGGAGVALLSPRGGAGVALLSRRGGAAGRLAILSPRGGAGGWLALLSSRGGAASPFAGVRSFATRPKGKAPLWSWETIKAKADELHDAVFSAHGLLYIFCSTSSGFAIYYVDRAIAEERRTREAFERRAVKCHQDLVERTITNTENLKEKMGSFWDRFLSYREDDLEHRGAVTKAADMLKSKGYVILPASDLEMMKSQIAELTLSMAEMTEFKEKFASDSLQDCNEEGIEKQFDSEKGKGNGGISDGVQSASSDMGAVKTVQKENICGEPGNVQPLSKKQFDSEKGKGNGGISDGVQSASSDMSAVKTVQKENICGEPGNVQPLSKKQFDSEKGKGNGGISDGVQSASSDMSAVKKGSNTGSRW